MTSLEEVQEKFDIWQERDLITVADTLAMMLFYCKENKNFEKWYNEQWNKERIVRGNFYLKINGYGEVTKEDLQLVYEHTRKNYLTKPKAITPAQSVRLGLVRKLEKLII